MFDNKKATVCILHVVSHFFLTGLSLGNVLSVVIIGRQENSRQHRQALNIQVLTLKGFSNRNAASQVFQVKQTGKSSQD